MLTVVHVFPREPIARSLYPTRQMRALLYMILLSACTRVGPGPAATLERYADALAQDRPRVAYDLLEPESQKQQSYEVFLKRWQQNQGERSAQAAELKKRLRSGLSVRTEVTLPLGQRYVLNRGEHGGPWRVMGLPSFRAEAEAQEDSPEAALLRLVRAAERRNYHAVLQVLSPARRQAIEAELTERLARLREALNQSSLDTKAKKIERRGDRARFQYDPRFYIELQRDADGWHIWDFN